MRVLLIGAYANGNLGDMYQADAIASVVKELRPDVEIQSVSPSKRGSRYPTDLHTAGPGSGALDLDYINAFDRVFIGGGGLFAAPHAPLDDDNWVGGVTAPMFAVSVGAAGEVVQTSPTFLKKCERVSVRDDYSLAAVWSIRPDARIVMDPILLDEITKPPLPSCGDGIAWVPGKIVPQTTAIWEHVARYLIDEADPVISFNPVTDRESGFDRVFAKLDYLASIDPFLSAAGSSGIVASERYHACIFALARGKPAVGVTLRSRTVTSKIVEFFRRAGCSQAIVRDLKGATRQSLRRAARSIDMDEVRAYLLSERDKLLDFVAACL